MSDPREPAAHVAAVLNIPYEQLLAALAECGAVIEHGWQPIETAPRGSRYFLAYDPEYLNIHSVNWWQGEWQEAGASYPLRRGLTHWRPLPAGPKP